MASQQHSPVEVDPAALENAKTLWNRFARALSFVVAASAVILLLMAFFLL